MGSKTKLLITILAVLAIGVVGFNAIGLAGQTSGQVDVSGPCDEAEHANDPECAGQPGVTPSPEDSPSVGVDISGPCDEAEHANDPRCNGAGRGDDNSGPGNGDDDDDDDNSGPGNGDDDDDDNSGPGNGDDDD